MSLRATRLASLLRSNASYNSVRAFSNAAPLYRAPALGDIIPGNAKEFDVKQREFRDGLKRAQEERERKEKEAREREHEAMKQETSGGKVPSTLKTIIYGTPEGRTLDRDIERSFSQVLARGKYTHSIVQHQVKPGHEDEYVELVGSWYPKIAGTKEYDVHLVGSWKTEVGDCNTFVHIWEYRGYAGLHRSLHAIQSHPDYPSFEQKLKPLLTHKHTSLMQEFSFWPTTPPRHLGGVFELRSYTLHPGNLLEWETHWRKGLRARREVMEGVGAWFVQIGELNTVHHLWQFADLEERKRRREESWGQEGWGDTVHKTVPLIQSMKSSILIPLPWSPTA